MPRTMWKGAISFGLVSIPVGLYPATEEKTLRFNQLHDKDHGRIKYQRTCSMVATRETICESLCWHRSS